MTIRTCTLDEQQCTEEHCLHRRRPEHGGKEGECSFLVPLTKKRKPRRTAMEKAIDDVGGGYGSGRDYREA